MQKGIRIIACLFTFTMLCQLLLLAQPAEKWRTMVLTDIENEPDDAQSLVRFLTYANQWDIEGIIATTSYWKKTALPNGGFMKCWKLTKKYNPTC